MALAKLDLLHLLPQLYGEVVVPAAVHDEVVTRGLAAGHADAERARDAAASGDISVVPTDAGTIGELVRALPIGQGERHAIHHALQRHTDWLLIDDVLAREAASAVGLRTKGTLEILAGAYRRGLMTAEELDTAFKMILDRDDIWIEAALVHRVWEEHRASE